MVYQLDVQKKQTAKDKKTIEAKPIKVTAIYGNKSLLDCMKSVIQIHLQK